MDGDWRSCAFSVSHYEDLLNKQPQIRQIRQADGQPLTGEQSQSILERSCAPNANCSIPCCREAIR